MTEAVDRPIRLLIGAAPLPRWITVAAYALPVLVLAALVLTYIISPTFYLTYVLEERNREYQAVELLTFACGAIATFLLLRSTIQLWKLNYRLGGWFIVAAVTLATIFFTGEEISWGQTYLGWATPESFRDYADNAETNLHNAKTPIRIQVLGSVFIIGVFLLLPLAWRLRRWLAIPESWSIAIPEGPIVFTFLCAFLWTRLKDVYLSLIMPDFREHDVLYVEFVEQMKEHKELLAAIGLLMYGAYRVKWVRLLRKDSMSSTRG